jgi:hypothetical protein
MNEFLDIMTDLLDEIRIRLPSATEDQKNDLRGLVRAYAEMVNRMDGVPSAGLSWSDDEELRLLQACQAGTSLEDLAKKHGRTFTAIVSRLNRLGVDTAKPLKPTRQPDKLKYPTQSPASLIAAARARLAKKQNLARW